MSPVPAQLTLSAFLYPAGQHITARQHDAHRTGSFDHYRRLAVSAEKGLFDFLFLPDAEGVRPHDEEVVGHGSKGFADQFESFTLLSALSMCTNRIGLVATASTSFNEPYHVARRLASLDRLSAGRAGWHVTVAQENFEIENLGRQWAMPRSARFTRAAEFIDVVTGLWGGAPQRVPDGRPLAVTASNAGQRVALHHHGEHFSVRGPLNIARSPQGRPVVATAVSSSATQALAARMADIVFSPHSSLGEARDFYADFKALVRSHGRDPARVRVLPDVFAVVGRSEAEARERYESMQPALDGTDSLALLLRCLNANRRGFSLDAPLPPIAQADLGGDVQALVEHDPLGRMTIRDIYLRMAGTRGHWTLVGTAGSIADALEQWFREQAADGFNLVPPDLPGSLDDFVALVVPELQRRGLFRTQYTGATLRDHLGLPADAGA